MARLLCVLVLAVLLTAAATAPGLAQCQLDQEQAVYNSTTGGDRWQSFTAGATGGLCRVEIDCQNASPTDTLMVYAGEGTGGTALHSQPAPLLAGITAVDLTAPVTVIAGATYTLRFTATNAWRIQLSDVYAGGQASCCVDGDYWFRTHVDGSQGTCTLDQEYTQSNSTAGGDRWQSFTPATSGELCLVEINCQNASAGGTVEIYAGQGAKGTPLLTQSVDLGSGVTPVPFTTPVPVTAGSLYTVRFTATNAWLLQIPGAYDGGEASTAANEDFWFRAYVDATPTPVEPTTWGMLKARYR